MGTPKNKPRNRGVFFVVKNNRQLTTFHHAIHHKLTTKTPPSASQFSPKPPQKDPDRTLKKYQFRALPAATMLGTHISVLAYQSIQSQARRGY
jgi:hypothetical protein